ncbi:MAG TPA: sulfur oxidation c-type cytochrome SoxX [Usitatibacteraceae bacterium]
MTNFRTVALLSACALVMTAHAADKTGDEKAVEVMKASFKERGQAKLDRLDSDETMSLCNKYAGGKLPVDVAKKIQAGNLQSIKLPADGKLLGDWKAGEKIAQSGVGKQFSDNPANPNGGNCYACHQLAPQELSYGNIGPSLYNYGKLRGNSAAIQQYTFGKIYNAEAYAACSNMPRFGHNGILTEQQIKDVTALLLDPESPVNK